MELKILQDCSKFNIPLPEAIANAPTLTQGLELYLDGFLDLTNCRSVGFGVSPIPHTAILDYCCFYGIIGEQQADFIWLVTHLDRAFLKWNNDNDDK